MGFFTPPVQGASVTKHTVDTNALVSDERDNEHCGRLPPPWPDHVRVPPERWSFRINDWNDPEKTDNITCVNWTDGFGPWIEPEPFTEDRQQATDPNIIDELIAYVIPTNTDAELIPLVRLRAPDGQEHIDVGGTIYDYYEYDIPPHSKVVVMPVVNNLDRFNPLQNAAQNDSFEIRTLDATLYKLSGKLRDLWADCVLWDTVCTTFHIFWRYQALIEAAIELPARQLFLNGRARAHEGFAQLEVQPEFRDAKHTNPADIDWRACEGTVTNGVCSPRYPKKVNP